MKKIGGFFGLHAEAATQPESLLALWGIPKHTHWMFANGRSALHQLLLHLAPETFWLPAYACASLAEAATDMNVRFFPLNDVLSPDCSYLEKHVAAGDAVLAIDYFGRNPNAAFLTFRNTRPDVHWIEDRAQAFLPSPTAWGDYVLYSPRKLLGVTDGGIIVGITASLPNMTYDAGIEPDATHPAVLRHEDVQETNNETWYKAYVATEAAMKVTRQPMSRMSRQILEKIDVQSIIAKRKANYATLLNRLAAIALLPAAPTDFVPFGFPIRTNDRQKIASLLHKNGIFAAHHWPELPSPADIFKNDHALAQRVLTLPCDHRYDMADMERIAALVGEAL